MGRVTAFFVFVFALLAPAPALADNSLVGWWPFDEGSGTVAHDASGQGNNGVISGPATWTQGYLGSALTFNGGSARVFVPDSPSLEPASSVSVTAWVKAAPQGIDKYIVAKGATSCLTASYGLYTGASGGLEFYVAESAGSPFVLSPDAGPAVWDGQWHFVAGTYDGADVRLYVDGREVGTGTPHTGPIDYAFSDRDLFIGHYNGCQSLDFLGSIDEPEVWSRALSASEIATAYGSFARTHSGGTTTPASPLPGVVAAPPAPSTPSEASQGSSRSTTISRLSLSGLATGAPRLGFSVSVPAPSSPLRSVTILLPRGLRFARSLTKVQRGVRAAHAVRYTLSLAGGGLIVQLRSPMRSVAVWITAPALAEDPALLTRVRGVLRSNRSKKHGRKTLGLKLAARLVDANRVRTTLTDVIVIS